MLAEIKQAQDTHIKLFGHEHAQLRAILLKFGAEDLKIEHRLGSDQHIQVQNDVSPITLRTQSLENIASLTNEHGLVMNKNYGFARPKNSHQIQLEKENELDKELLSSENMSRQMSMQNEMQEAVSEAYQNPEDIKAGRIGAEGEKE